MLNRAHCGPRRIARGAGLASVVVVITVASGCGSPKLGDGLVLEPERVAEVLERRAGGDVDLVVLDVRPLDQYRESHLTGARWLDLTTWSRLSRSPDKGFADRSGWQKRIGDFGIAAEDRVLVYDGGEMTEAARIWYILQLFGVKDVAVIDAGFPALRAAAGEKMVSGDPPAPAAKAFQPAGPAWLKPREAPTAAKLADKEAVRSTIAGKKAKILDARTMAEYQGRDAKHNPRAGHMPDAINIPHGKMLDARGRLKTAAELQKLFADAGLKPGDAIVAHCQSGGRAALAALAAKRAGFTDVSNYYMSFGEWAQDETCPLEGKQEPQAGAQE